MTSNHMNSSISNQKQDIEQLLRDGVTIRIKPQGNSMYPLFHSGRDDAYISPADPGCLRRGDVVLYRRDHGILVLHRIWKCNANGFYMVGDNQTEIEGPLRPDQIRGKLTGIVHCGHTFSVRNPLYCFLSWLWLFLRPIRPVIWHTMSGLRKFLRHFH